MNIYKYQFLPIELKNFIIKTVQKIRIYSSINHFKNFSPQFQKYNLSRLLGPQKKICYAPFKSMFFTKDGNVYPCCLNRAHSFGEITTQSVNEIWTGDKISELRKLLDKSDLPVSCSHCKNRIMSGNFDAVKARHYDEISLKKKYPSMLEFELSNNCNLKCIMCSPEFSSSIKKENISDINNKEVYNEDFIKQLEEYIPHIEKAEFLGGEPFFIPIYYEIWNKIIKLNPNCIILVQSNGTILNDRIKLLLSKGNFRISVSIDSFRKTTYELIRKCSNFENVLGNINFFADYATKNKYPLGISVCPMKQNWEELPEIVKKCNDLNAFIHFNTVSQPQECSLFDFSIKELSNVYKVLSLIELQNKSRVEKKNKYHFDCFLNQLNSWILEKKNIHEQLTNKSIWWEQKAPEIESITIEEHTKLLLEYLGCYTDITVSEKQGKNNFDNYFKNVNLLIKYFGDFRYLKQLFVKLKEFPPEAIMEVLGNEDIEIVLKNAVIVQKELINEIEYTKSQ